MSLPSLWCIFAMLCLSNANFFINFDNLQISRVSESDVCDKVYPGIQDIRHNLSSWQWVYGKTPNFTINHATADLNGTVALRIKKGLIQNVSFHSLCSLHSDADRDESTQAPAVNRSTCDTLSSHAHSIDNARPLIGLPFCPLTIPNIINSNETLKADVICREIVHLFEKIKSGVWLYGVIGFSLICLILLCRRLEDLWGEAVSLVKDFITALV